MNFSQPWLGGKPYLNIAPVNATPRIRRPGQGCIFIQSLIDWPPSYLFLQAAEEVYGTYMVQRQGLSVFTLLKWRLETIHVIVKICECNSEE
jgi:hypothetical protein